MEVHVHYMYMCEPLFMHIKSFRLSNNGILCRQVSMFYLTESALIKLCIIYLHKKRGYFSKNIVSTNLSWPLYGDHDYVDEAS